MNRRISFAFAGLEALFAVLLGLAFVLLPVSIIWLFENDASIDWMTAFRGSIDVWMLAHGVRLEVAAGSVLGTSVSAFGISLMPLGLTLIILGAAFRVGRRYSNAATLLPVWLGAALVYEACALLLGSLAATKAVAPVSWMTPVLPVAVFLLGLVTGSLTGRVAAGREAPERVAFANWFEARRKRWHWAVGALWQPAWRAGSISLMLQLTIAALTLSVLIALNWIGITRLYEGLQVTVLGGFLVTLAQILLLPNLVVYTASWFTGAGFVVGAGSSISPLGTTAGPMPSVPLFATIPAQSFEFGLIALAVPMLAGIIATLSVRRSADRIRFEFASALSAALSLGLAIALVTTAEFTALAAIASGSIGPDRLQTFGANLVWLAPLVFIETAIAATAAGFVTAKPDPSA